MNNYTYEDITVGMKESFSVEITDEMRNKFRDITGDINPLHNDESYAKEMGHKGCVVFGMMTASFLSTLAGVYLPGKKSLIQSTEVSFRKPVYIGDTLTVTGEVTEKNDTFNLFDMKVSIVNQNGVKVLKGNMRVAVEK